MVAANIRAAAAIVIDKRFIDFGIIILPGLRRELDLRPRRPFGAHCMLVRSVGPTVKYAMLLAEPVERSS